MKSWKFIIIFCLTTGLFAEGEESLVIPSGDSEVVVLPVDPILTDQSVVEEHGFEVVGSDSLLSELCLTDSLDLLNSSTQELALSEVLNAKLVGEREDIEKQVNQAIEREFLKRDKEQSFSARHLVLVVFAAFCFGVVSKYAYDQYCFHAAGVDRRLLVVEEQQLTLQKTIVSMQEKIAKEFNDLYKKLESGDKKKSLRSAEAGGNSYHFTFDNSSQTSPSDPLATVAAVGSAVGAVGKVASTCFCW